MPCHTTTSHTRHTVFQLLTLTHVTQHQSADAPATHKVTHRSPHVSTVHTHFKQHQSAHAPTNTTQQCLPYTGHPIFQLLTLTHVKQHQSADAPASMVPHSNVHHTQVTPFFNCSLTSGNTSLLMPCHTTSHTGHPMFQLLTLTRFKQHQSADALPHSKVKHSWSPHVSTAHRVTLTHFKLHQSADAPITQHCSSHTGW